MDTTSAIKLLAVFSNRYKKLENELRKIGRDVSHTDFEISYRKHFSKSSDTLA